MQELLAELITYVKVPGQLWRGAQQDSMWFSTEYAVRMQNRHVLRQLASESQNTMCKYLVISSIWDERQLGSVIGKAQRHQMLLNRGGGLEQALVM
jgi:hypothetical protein